MKQCLKELLVPSQIYPKNPSQSPIRQAPSGISPHIHVSDSLATPLCPMLATSRQPFLPRNNTIGQIEKQEQCQLNCCINSHEIGIHAIANSNTYTHVQNITTNITYRWIPTTLRFSNLLLNLDTVIFSTSYLQNLFFPQKEKLYIVSSALHCSKHPAQAVIYIGRTRDVIYMCINTMEVCVKHQ